MRSSVSMVVNNTNYHVMALNFTSYGASLVYLDEHGNRLTPLYDYLKPLPEKVIEGFYESWGGIEEFSRRTASPALGMLNSGLQILWLKKDKPDIFIKIKTVLHLPQYQVLGCKSTDDEMHFQVDVPIPSPARNAACRVSSYGSASVTFPIVICPSTASGSLSGWSAADTPAGPARQHSGPSYRRWWTDSV